MKKQTPTFKGEKVQRLKLLLASGKKYFTHELDDLLKVNNCAEVVRRLREEEYVKMEMVKNERTGTWEGQYSMPRAKKVNRITSGTYRNVI